MIRPFSVNTRRLLYLLAFLDSQFVKKNYGSNQLSNRKYYYAAAESRQKIQYVKTIWTYELTEYKVNQIWKRKLAR